MNMKASKLISAPMMVSKLSVCRLIFMGLLSWISGSAALAADAAQIQSVVEGNTAFALELYGQLKTQPGNLFFSPYSISTCLAMTYAGAAGETEKQMAHVFHFGTDQAQLH